MDSEIYFDNWSTWQDVVDNFSPRWGHNTKQIEEPEEVILASYHQGGYEGDAWVVYRDGDAFYTVSAGHCSWYGLEDQWEPEKFESAELLLAYLEKAKGYGVQAEYRALVMDRLRAKLNEVK